MIEGVILIASSFMTIMHWYTQPLRKYHLKTVGLFYNIGAFLVFLAGVVRIVTVI